MASQLRRPFLEYIAGFGIGRRDVGWWSSRVAERNVDVNPLFRHCCYLGVAQRAIRSTSGSLVIVAESGALLRQIAVDSTHRPRIVWVTSPSALRSILLWIIRMFFVWSRYMLRASRDLISSRRRSRPGPPITERQRILLHSCMNEESFTADGLPYDGYFRNLGKELQAKGYDVLVLPWLYNIRRSRRDALVWFRAHSNQYVVPEDYYTLSDYVWAAGVVIAQAWGLRGQHVFAGRDITRLVREACLAAATDTGVAQFVRYARLIPHLKAAGVRFDIFLDKFENMVTEKPQVLALRQHMPEVLTVGYQHYLAPYPLQLHMFTTSAEAMWAPHPDVIVCNSRFTRMLFAQEGFPQEKLRLGPSLRYEHLLQPRSGGQVHRDSILVVLPLDAIAATEMVAKLIAAFPAPDGFRLLLKVHPMMDDRTWARARGGRLLPAHMEQVGDSMDRWVAEAACAIVTPSTTSGLELLLAGLPSVIVGRDCDLEMNPVAWFTEWDPPVHSPESLRMAVLRILAALDEHRMRVEAWAARWREACVTPLNEDTIRAFVDPPQEVQRRTPNPMANGSVPRRAGRSQA